MIKKKLKELVISYFVSDDSYKRHQSENADGLNLVALGGEPEGIYDQGKGYIRYVSGRCECWGFVRGNSNCTVTFPVPFKETPSLVLVSVHASDRMEAHYSQKVTKTSMDVLVGKAGTAGAAAYWFVRGCWR